MFTSEQWLGFIRHILTGLGGMFVAAGWIDESTAAQLVGGAMTVAGFVWSWVTKSR